MRAQTRRLRGYGRRHRIEERTSIDAQDLTVVVIGFAVAEAFAILLVFDAVMRPRSSQGAIAWAIGLVAMPLVTVPLYLLFGRTRFEGYTEALREAHTHVGEHTTLWYSRMAARAASVAPALAPVEAVVRSLTGISFAKGNRVELLVDGEATYASMLDAIESAKAYVLVQFYIVRDDVAGRRMRDSLIGKARAGVRVHFLYDEIGSWALPAAFLDEMRAHAIEVSGFKTTRGRRNRFQVNFRNHRKLLVVDGRTGFIGGLNLGDEYLGYRDTHLRVDGPAAQQIQMSFLKDWYWANRRILAIDTEIPPGVTDGQAVAVVSTGPADGVACCSLLFTTLFNAATKRIWISSPYFVPDDVAVRALQGAALRGVDVRIILPGKADHRLVELASYTYHDTLLASGVRLFRYQDRFMHQKVFLVDHELAGVGTVNLDNRSLYLNFEATALVADRGFAARVEAMLESDLERSTPVDADQFESKPLRVRAAARLARLASPLL